MRVAFFDCVGGVSGDMLLSSLIDAGASKNALQNVIRSLKLTDCSATVEKVMRGALSAQQVTITTPRQEIERHLAELVDIIDQAEISQDIKDRSKSVLKRIAQVEAKIHDSTIDSIHLHEVGGDDTLIDIVGVLSMLEELEIERVYSSSLPLARGMINSMHGLIPLPAPATLALLKDVPVRYLDNIEAELVTPTGAALLTSLVDDFTDFPPMKIERIGIGAGHRDLPFPNVVRVLIGVAEQLNNGLIIENLVQLETNIDDVNPQVYEHIMSLVFAAGALDVTLAAVQMKKNRTGEVLSILCQPQNVEQIQSILFSEGITLGVRRTSCERVSLPRTVETVETPFGAVKVKIAQWDGFKRVMPEYEDCLKAATLHQVPLLRVMASAQEAYQ